MIWLARIAVGLVCLFSLAMAGLAYLDPAASAEALGMSAQSGLGQNSYRSDIGAFFMASAIGAGGALFLSKRHWLILPIALYGLAAMGRLLGIALDGAPDGVAVPIIVEAVLVLLCLFGLRTLGAEAR